MSIITSPQMISYMLFILCFFMTVFKSLLLGRTFHGMFIYQIVYSVSVVLQTFSFSGLAIQSHLMFKKVFFQNQCEIYKDCQNNEVMILTVICSFGILILGIYMKNKAQTLRQTDGKRKILKGIYFLFFSILKITFIPIIFSFHINTNLVTKIVNLSLVITVLLFHFLYLKGLIIINFIRNPKKLLIDVTQCSILMLIGIILIVAKVSKVKVLYLLIPMIILYFVLIVLFYKYVILKDFINNINAYNILKIQIYIQIVVNAITNILLIMTIAFLFGYESRLVAIDLDFVLIGLAVIIEVSGLLLTMKLRLNRQGVYGLILLVIQDRQVINRGSLRIEIELDQAPPGRRMQRVNPDQVPNINQINNQIIIQFPNDQ